jgi:DNA modification methylase
MNVIEFGDCRATMRRWKEQGIKAQTCVTSPPYYGLRDYGHEGQIGLEETPEEYIKAMVEVFRCVWDVLEDDGTLWLNIGDSYFSQIKGSGGKNSSTLNAKRDENGTVIGKSIVTYEPIRLSAGETGCKPKDLIGIPWMMAFALRADGWYLRQDIIWHKPNPMPESVQDRCTKAHEYIFLMSKSQKYYYDSDAIKEQMSEDSKARLTRGVSEIHKNVNGAPGQTPHSMNQPRKNGENTESPDNRNKRSVWTVTTKPYAGAHFAVFPSDLIEPCILAGAPVGGIVLDPFMGSGTTGQVAQNLGRQYIGCELNADYKPLQDRRLAQQSLVFED